MKKYLLLLLPIINNIIKYNGISDSNELLKEALVLENLEYKLIDAIFNSNYFKKLYYVYKTDEEDNTKYIRMVAVEKSYILKGVKHGVSKFKIYDYDDPMWDNEVRAIYKDGKIDGVYNEYEEFSENFMRGLYVNGEKKFTLDFNKYFDHFFFKIYKNNEISVLIYCNPSDLIIEIFIGNKKIKIPFYEIEKESFGYYDGQGHEVKIDQTKIDILGYGSKEEYGMYKGLKSGASTTIKENGNIVDKSLYVNGKRFGMRKIENIKENTINLSYYEDDIKRYYEFEITKDYTLANPVENGDWVKFYETGEIEVRVRKEGVLSYDSTVYYINGDKEIRNYLCNGKYISTYIKFE